MEKITIETNVAATIADVWRAFNEPDDIVEWDAAEDWYTPRASNDLIVPRFGFWVLLSPTK